MPAKPKFTHGPKYYKGLDMNAVEGHYYNQARYKMPPADPLEEKKFLYAWWVKKMKARGIKVRVPVAKKKKIQKKRVSITKPKHVKSYRTRAEAKKHMKAGYTMWHSPNPNVAKPYFVFDKTKTVAIRRRRSAAHKA